MSKSMLWVVLTVAGLVLGAWSVQHAGSALAPQGAQALSQANEQFDKKNYRDAANAYAAYLKGLPAGSPWDLDRHHAHQQLMSCQMRLSLFEEALKAAEAYVADAAGTHHEARACHLAGNLYLTVPHWGTRTGGVFHRGQWKQGIQVRSHRHDKAKSLALLEKARAVYAQYDVVGADREPRAPTEVQNWRSWRISLNFDLAAACARFGAFENEWTYWWNTGERDDEAAASVSEEDFDEYHSDWQMRRHRPLGLPVGLDGKPVFAAKPAAYAAGLPDEEKILFLLDEVHGLDSTQDKRYSALSLLRQAMLARARFGMDRVLQVGQYLIGSEAYKKELEAVNPWELGDSEALVLAGGRVVRAELPPQFNVSALLSRLVAEHPRTHLAGEAQYALGLYLQSRQQYLQAIAQYERVVRDFPEVRLDPDFEAAHAQAVKDAAQAKGAQKGPAAEALSGFEDRRKELLEARDWARHARQQIGNIRRPQVNLSQTAAQLPGADAKVQLSHRNTGRVWFVARRINGVGFMEEIRQMPATEELHQRSWSLAQWDHSFVQGYYKPQPGWNQKLAAKHIGPEVARWSDEVRNDGSHRYATSALPIPLKERGTYLLFAYDHEPAPSDAGLANEDLMNAGDSRAVITLADVAIVEKKVKEGNLYFLADAASGRPLEQTQVHILETWAVYNQPARRQDYFRKMHELKTDANGLVILPRVANRYSHLHVLAKAPGDRVAWTGLHYWSHYHPSQMQDATYAYVLTDRPVYRPEQSVRFKVWLRQMKAGEFENQVGRHATVTIYDPRGNKVHEHSQATDPFGGIEGQFALAAEPPLGAYRVHIQSLNRGVHGGGSFRVEEYKKPEFEVTVEPTATHARLGDKVSALIRAKYYFGGAVSDAEVSYRVFREEYRHNHFFPGRWDWLYGPGYGWSYYPFEAFPFWSRMGKCFCVPPTWWGYNPGNPVRELVSQGKGRIGADGTLKVDIDTANALKLHGDLDHRYVVEADVRDASRRTISGEGGITVTRQAFYAFTQPERGYYRPGDEVVVNLRCLTPDSRPVQTQGVLNISSVVFGGPNNAHLNETPLHRAQVQTDERGELTLRFRYEKSGQLKFHFSAPDAWGQTVDGYALVWVVGDDFQGEFHHFNDLELITDKRTYQPGDTARVMINSRQPGGYVLFSDNVDSNHLLDYRLIHLPQRSTVVEVPIRKGHAPNFFLEATTVRGTRVHTQSLRVAVPPESGVIDVALSTDQEEYRPGQTAHVEVAATDSQGKPAEAQFVLSAFDKSVLYIQGETAPLMARFFHGNLRHHSPVHADNLTEQYAAYGSMHRPFESLWPQPESWSGIWGPGLGDPRTFLTSDLKDFGNPATRTRELQALGENGAMSGRRGMALGGAVELRKSNAPGAPMAAAEPAMNRADARPMAAKSADKLEKADGSPAESADAPAQLRTQFADTALWLATLTTDPATGRAKASFTVPDNLTTWRINAHGMTKSTRVGQSSREVISTKNLLVRLQAPRFFTEYDEVVLSAIVNNRLPQAKMAKVSIELPPELLQLLAPGEPYAPRETQVMVPAGGEKRVDWRIKVRKEGLAPITVQALTDTESDAMRLSLPVLVHGMTQQVSKTGLIRAGESVTQAEIELNIPEQRRPELTRLEVQYAPSLVGAMLDALPYTLDYPYHNSEATMSRFLPAVLTLQTLQNVGIRMEDVAKARGRLDEIRRIEKGERISIYSHIENPVFESGELQRIIKAGLDRILASQNGDGGWGWWKGNESDGYMTSYVLYALVTAQRADIRVEDQVIKRAVQSLKRWTAERMAKEHWRPDALYAFVAHALALAKDSVKIDPAKGDRRPPELIERLWAGRDELNLYGKALLALTFAERNDAARADQTLDNMLQFLDRNPESQLAWFRTPQAGWWYWWNNEIETNAWCLRALTRIRPKSDVSPALVKWLLNNRKNGYYWRNTRDTTLCVHAMSDYARASGETAADYTLTLDLDNGKVVKRIKIDRENFLTYDNRFVIEGVSLTGGKHTLRISKEGDGAVYFNAYLRYFTKEVPIKAAGLELQVARTYSRLEQVDHTAQVETSSGAKIDEKRLRYKLIPLKDGDEVKSGETVLVELRVKSDNTYTYLGIEDRKPAGFEPVEVRSGGKGQEGFHSYMELRDEKTVFFINAIEQGEHLLRYRLRAETPGVFHSLPASIFGVYVPELRGNSDEQILKVRD